METNLKLHWFLILMALNWNAGHAEVIEDAFSLELEEIRTISPAPGTVISKENVDAFVDVLAPELDALIKMNILMIANISAGPSFLLSAESNMLLESQDAQNQPS